MRQISFLFLREWRRLGKLSAKFIFFFLGSLGASGFCVQSWKDYSLSNCFYFFFFCQVADVLIEGGTISAVGTDLDGTEDALVIDAEGKMVLPGGVDAATNFHTAKGEGVGVADDFESGTRAALAGKPTYEVYLN